MQAQARQEQNLQPFLRRITVGMLPPQLTEQAAQVVVALEPHAMMAVRAITITERPAAALARVALVDRTVLGR